MREFIFGLIGGTALLMYGVDKMGDGLEKASGNFMKKILSVLTGRVWSAFFVGIATTVMVQSSTAITVLTVGFVNAGLMKLSQAVGIIYGANIGTTVTAQLMAFSFKFKLTEIALPVIAGGFIIQYFAKKENLKHVGNAIMGFGMMFLGLKLLNDGSAFIKASEPIKAFFQNYASITILGILMGMIATALVHSSSATVALVMMLGVAGVIDFRSALAIMLGDNIGTCITAQLASMTGNINARRTAWAHSLYNIIGVLICLIFYNPFLNVVVYATQWMYGKDDIALQIANAHTIFNVLSAVVFLPINKYYVKFLETIIRDKKKDEYDLLDKHLLATPSAAFKAILAETIKALELSKDMINMTINAFLTNDATDLSEVKVKEEKLNRMQKDVISYIVEVSKQTLSEEYTPMIPAFINSINNIERVGDHTIEYMRNITNKIDKKLPFSQDSLDEIENFRKILTEMIDMTIVGVNTKDRSGIDRMKVLEQQTDDHYEQAMVNHIKRLEMSNCDVEAGIIFVDLVTHMERMADHIYKVFKISTSNNVIQKL